nr:C69 family dipeptidase [Candidatus Saccharicenans sp.]
MKHSGFKFNRLAFLLVATCGLGLILSFSLGGKTAFIQKEQTARIEPDRLEFDSCTSIMVGRLASADGSTMTSHSCDSNTDRTWINIIPHTKHRPGEKAEIYFEPKRLKSFDDPDRVPVGEIPQVAETNAYFNAAYPFMNEWQLAAGETTIGGRRELKSDEGLLDAPELLRLMLERARTAREAIKVADELTRKYGYNDWGESL